VVGLDSPKRESIQHFCWGSKRLRAITHQFSCRNR